MLKALEESTLSIFEVLLLLSVISFSITMQTALSDQLTSTPRLMPNGSCVQIFSDHLITFNGTIYGYSLTICKNNSRVEVIQP
ncbi:MAG: hypothetical protein ABWK01_03155 [Infirmifilum sp.]